MVFRNLRERFGIDDQDYQVRGVFVVGGVRECSGVWRPQDKERKDSHSRALSSCPVLLQPGGLSPVPVGSWIGVGAQKCSVFFPREAEQREGNGLWKLPHLSLTFPV